jgi:Flp pilus assembly protein TadB
MMDKGTKSFLYHSIFMFIGIVSLTIVIGLYAHWLLLLAASIYVVIFFFKSLRMILNLYEKDMKIKRLKKEIEDLETTIKVTSRDYD